MALEHFRNKRPRYLSVLSRLASGGVLSGVLSNLVSPVLGGRRAGAGAVERVAAVV